VVRDLASGKEIGREELFLGFTRHTPALVTNGKSGLNASIKGVGFIPNDDVLPSLLERFMAHIKSEYDEEYGQRGLLILDKHLWSNPENFSMLRLGTIELAKMGTWENIKENPSATLLFYQPPVVSFELRTNVIIHEDGLIHNFVNAMHDMYHKPDVSRWNERPVYELIVERITDKSATEKGFSRSVYKVNE
jgi:hypothetical protein